jgi:cytochrome c oxidase subunit 2
MSARGEALLAAGIWAVLSIAGVAIVLGMHIMPSIASREAEIEDGAFVLLTAASVPVLLAVVVPLVYSAIRFRARRAEGNLDGPPIHGHRAFEVGWVTVSFAAVIGLAAYGSIGLIEIRGDAQAALQVRAVAKQWAWKYEYPGTGVVSKDLVLPVGERVHIVIVAEDVIHSFTVPAFGVKQDAVPGRETHLDVTPTFTGEYGAQCAELCGFGHTSMVTKVRVLEPAEFAAWLDQEQGPH